MMPVWKQTRPGVESMSVAVMGCVVNGPGESKAANIGISLPGTGESPNFNWCSSTASTPRRCGTYDELAVAFQRLVDEHAANVSIFIDGRHHPTAVLELVVRASCATGPDATAAPMRTIFFRIGGVNVMPTSNPSGESE